MRLRNSRKDERRSLYADDWVTDAERDDLGDEAAAALALRRHGDARRGRPAFEPTEGDVVHDRAGLPTGGRRDKAVVVEIEAYRRAVLAGQPLPWRDDEGEGA